MSLKNIKKLIYYYLSLLIIPNNLSATPLACPVCAVAIASGLGLSRTFGVKDGVIGIWTGALLLAISQGCVTFLRKKNTNKSKNYIFGNFCTPVGNVHIRRRCKIKPAESCKYLHTGIYDAHLYGEESKTASFRE